MTETHVPSRVFPRARQDAETANAGISTPQTENPAYRLAFQDMDFLLREDLRPVRFQLELLKPELILAEANIASTFVMYGSARIPEPAKAKALLELAEGEEAIRIAKSLVAKSKYYDVALRAGPARQRLPARRGRQAPLRGLLGRRPLDHGSGESRRGGSGPRIDRPQHRAAARTGAEPYVTPSLSMQFHYFALRKMHFLLHARALAAFPGGFGTFDELFELLTLIQTGKIKPIPVLLFGREFWNRVVNFEALVEEGVISARDLNIFTFVETAEEAWKVVQDFYQEPADEAE